MKKRCWSHGSSFEVQDRHGRMISVVQSVRRLTSVGFVVDYRTSMGMYRDYITCMQGSSPRLGTCYRKKQWRVHSTDNYPHDPCFGTLLTAIDVSAKSISKLIKEGKPRKPLLQVKWVELRSLSLPDREECSIDSVSVGYIVSATFKFVGGLYHGPSHFFDTPKQAREWVVAQWMHLVIGEPEPVLPELKKGS